MIKNVKVYDTLMLVAQILLPVIGTLYAALAGIFELSNTGLVVGSVVAVDALLGVILRMSSRVYTKSEESFDGSMDVQQVGDKTVFRMAFTSDDQLDTLADKQEVRFKVNKLDE